MSSYNYIAVEGGIGSGKTLLAEMIAEHLNAHKLLDEWEHNPFLDEFYHDMERNAFSAQVFFLLSRHRQIRGLLGYDLFHDIIVSDFLYERSEIFANITLREDEFRLYSEIGSLLQSELPAPDLAIYLQGSPELMFRRARRARLPVDRDYIEHLSAAYDYFFFHYDRSPLLIVNIDTVEISADYNEIFAFIERSVVGTEYLSKGPKLF